MGQNNFSLNKRILIIIGILLIFLFVIIMIRLITYRPIEDNIVIDIPKSSSPGVSSMPGALPSVSMTSPTPKIQPLVYSPGQLKKDYDRINNKKTLSERDSSVREQLVSKADDKSGIITENTQFKLEYISSPNLFMVEVRSSDPEFGKDAAEIYLKNQGLSEQGLCNLPIIFYLSQSVQNDLLSKGETFNPIPEECE